MSVESMDVARQRRLKAELAARAAHPAGKARKVFYGYTLCSTCGYEREVGVPCGLPCV